MPSKETPQASGMLGKRTESSRLRDDGRRRVGSGITAVGRQKEQPSTAKCQLLNNRFVAAFKELTEYVEYSSGDDA